MTVSDTTFKARFEAALAKQHAAIAGQHGVPMRLRQGERESSTQTKPRPALPSPIASSPPAPTAADLEFDRVKKASLDRLAEERAARNAEEAAAATILDAVRAAGPRSFAW